MATIESKQIIDELIECNGYFGEDHPQVALIVEYTNAYGNITYGVTWTNESLLSQAKYLIESEYVRNPKIIWSSNPVIMRMIQR